MGNYESNRNGWKDDCCCESNKKDWKDKEHECDHHDKDHHKKEECCCKESMKEALKLLKDPKIYPNLKIDHFAFIGHHYTVGTFLEEDADQGNDNLSFPCATFNGFDSCNCDLVNIVPTDKIYYPHDTGNPSSAHKLDLYINRVSLCDLEAISFFFDCSKAEFEADLTALLDKHHEKCYFKCDECCCNNGIFNAISNSNQVNLTAGWLAVKDAKVLGRIGNVLVLSNTGSEKQIYFVCLDSVGFINI